MKAQPPVFLNKVAFLIKIIDNEEIEKKKKQNELFKKLENRRAGILLPFNIPEKALEEGNQSSPNPSTPKKARRRSNLNVSFCFNPFRPPEGTLGGEVSSPKQVNINKIY